MKRPGLVSAWMDRERVTPMVPLSMEATDWVLSWADALHRTVALHHAAIHELAGALGGRPGPPIERGLAPRRRRPVGGVRRRVRRARAGLGGVEGVGTADRDGGPPLVGGAGQGPGVLGRVGPAPDLAPARAEGAARHRRSGPAAWPSPTPGGSRPTPPPGRSGPGATSASMIASGVAFARPERARASPAPRSGRSSRTTTATRWASGRPPAIAGSGWAGRWRRPWSSRSRWPARSTRSGPPRPTTSGRSAWHGQMRRSPPRSARPCFDGPRGRPADRRRARGC